MMATAESPAPLDLDAELAATAFGTVPEPCRWLDPSATPPARILVAEDDDAMRDLIATVLRNKGFDVVEARDGGELVDFVEALTDGWAGASSIGLVISDVRMPGLFGTDVVDALRRGGWRVPVILMTAFGTAAVREQADAIGADLIDKPFALESLLAMVSARLPSAPAAAA